MTASRTTPPRTSHLRRVRRGFAPATSASRDSSTSRFVLSCSSDNLAPQQGRATTLHRQWHLLQNFSPPWQTRQPFSPRAFAAAAWFVFQLPTCDVGRLLWQSPQKSGVHAWHLPQSIFSTIWGWICEPVLAQMALRDLLLGVALHALVRGLLAVVARLEARLHLRPVEALACSPSARGSCGTPDS